MKQREASPVEAARNPNASERETPVAEKIASLHDRVRLARREMDSRYYSNLSCRHLGEIAQLSESALVRSFKKIYGISPCGYLLRVRIQRAKKLMEFSRQPLEAIAVAVGFNSASSMSNAFRRAEKTSLTRAAPHSPYASG